MTDFDAPCERHRSGSLKYDLFGDGPEMLQAWVADMDVPAAAPIREAITETVQRGLLGYAWPLDEHRQAVADWQRERFGWAVEPRWVQFTPGLGFALHLVGQLCDSVGASLLCSTPIYPPFMNNPRRAGFTVLTAPLGRSAAGWEMDLDLLAARIRPDTRMLLLCNPHNPVGQVFPRAQLEAVAEFCLRHDLLLCSDEVWADLILDEGVTHVPMASLGAEIAARTITLNAPSKAFNLAGLGCAYVVIPDPGLRRRWQDCFKGHGLDMPLTGLSGLRAAYLQGLPWLEELRPWLRGNRDHLFARLATEAPRIVAHPGAATYLAWLDLRGSGLVEPHRSLLSAGLRLSPGADFGDAAGLRLNFGCPRPYLDRIVDRLIASLPA